MSSFHATLGSRQRIITGVFGIGLGFGAPFLLSVVLVATSGDPSLLILPLPFLGGLWVIQGLAPSGFTLEEGGLRLERRWLPRLIPCIGKRTMWPVPPRATRAGEAHLTCPRSGRRAEESPP